MFCGDSWRHDPIISQRAVETNEVTTPSWAHLLYELVEEYSRRIVGVARVVYDIPGKSSATIWRE